MKNKKKIRTEHPPHYTDAHSETRELTQDLLRKLKNFSQHFCDTEQYDLALKFSTLFLKTLGIIYKHNTIAPPEGPNILLNLDWINMEEDHIRQGIEHIKNLIKK
jgi:hypothetical protein